MFGDKFTLPSVQKCYFKYLNYICCYFLLLHICLLSVINGYNVNVDDAVVFSDPYKRPRNRGSYFGYSVALYKGPNFRDPSVLVGAPRANISQLWSYEPGSVFKCTLDGLCKQWILDSTQNGKLNGMYGNQMRDNSWLGGSIAVEDKDTPRVLVCAPRWKLDIVGSWFMNGICYSTRVLTEDAFERPIFDRIRPLTNYVLQTKKTPYGQVVPHYAMGQLGFSAHIYSDMSTWNAVLGAPGTYSWYGAPILVTVDNYRTTSLIPPYFSADTEYFGYSVTSGYYFGGKERLFASSAPRSGDMKGRAFIFNYNIDNNAIKVRSTVSGTQHGEYFGYSLTTCDVDNNKYDDLIVGAPLWSKNGDEGRIYLFSVKNSKYLQLSSWINGDTIDGRFGMSVICLGDIDRDGYKDIAVGAPYEDGYGAVYIFNGRESGLSKKWSQRIAGDQFAHTLKGFGSSISEPKDVDGNGYNDIAVGAYESGHAVLLRTQPVVTLNITILNSDKTKLQADSKSFYIHVCASYNGVNAPSYLKIIKNLKIDPVLERASIGTFLLKNGSYDWFDILYYDIQNCKKVQILLVKNIRNILDPIVITASIDLNPTENENKVIQKLSIDFCSTCPVLNNYFSKTEDTIKIPFVVDCGPDNICHSNITLNVMTNLGNGNRYVIGTEKTLEIFININNYGEAAYQTDIAIFLPEYFSLSSLLSNCFENVFASQTYIKCNLDNPFRTQQTVKVEVEMSLVDSDKDHADIYIELSTMSENVNAIPPKHNLTIHFDIDADITLAGKSQESLYSFVDEETNEKIKSTRFNHIYEIQKYGATPIQQATLKVLIPTHLIDNDQTKVEIAAINATTLSRLSFAGKYNSHCTQLIENKTETLAYLADETDSLIDTSYNETLPTIPPYERTLYLNCSNPSVICTTLFCVIESPTTLITIAKVTMTFDLLMSNFDHVMDGKDIIYFVTDGRANITIPQGIVQKIDHKPDTFSLRTTFVGSPKRYVATWIIALSIFLGLLILILLIFGLIKLGFFNRKKKDELEALKANEDKHQGFVLETTSSREGLSES